jgi:hypothetical protein
MPQTLPSPPKTPPNGSKARVWFADSPKVNKAFKPPTLVRQKADLSDNKENIPPNDDEKPPQQDQPKET